MTLTELAIQSRVLAKLAAVFLLVFIVFYVMVLFLMSALKKPQETTLTIKPAFGKLERPFFEQAVETEKLKFVLDTIDVDYPPTTPSARVFFIPEQKTTLQYLNKIEALAQSFGFDTTVVKYQPINDSWVKYEDENKFLKINIKTFHFDFYFKPSKELQDLVEATPEARFDLLENEYIEMARDVLKERNAYPVDLAVGKTNIVYLRYDLALEKFIAIKSDEVPQAIRVDFFRKDEDLPVVPAKYFESANFVILTPLTKNPEAVAAQYLSFEKLDEEPGIYPLIDSRTAWEFLQKGKVKTISLDANVEGKIKIKELFVAYYDPISYQKYFQPIYVFLGDHNYVGYLEAVRPEYFSDYKEDDVN